MAEEKPAETKPKDPDAGKPAREAKPETKPSDETSNGESGIDWKAESRKQEKRAKESFKREQELEARLAKVEDESKSEHDKELDKARKEAAKQATDEVTASFRKRVLRAEIRALAANNFADPDDAVALLDLQHDEVFDSEGDVVKDKVKSALADLLEAKPHLKADGAGTQGAADAGRGEPTSGLTPEQAHNKDLLRLAGLER